uniref:Xanthine dehydrogenase n=1 Tax=Cyanistes caeruleus TaxID=156563 RepID=A0A8C0VBS3_CYACU
LICVVEHFVFINIFPFLQVVEKDVDPETTLLTYLRRKSLSNEIALMYCFSHHTANACLFPICALHHVAVTTVEGIGNTKSRLHPAQERIAKSHGSQCGFCTPGIVMSMYTLLRNNPEPHMEDIEDAFQGNIHRDQTYYISLECAIFFSEQFLFPQDMNCCGRVANGTGCCRSGRENTMFQPLDPTQEPIFPPELMVSFNKQQKQMCFKGERVMWIQPTTLSELVALKSQYPNAKLVVGNTEVGIEMRLKNLLYPVIIAPAWIPEMNAVQHTETGVTIGAACTLKSVEEVMRKAVSDLPPYKTEIFQAVLEQLRWFAGPQIRNVAVSDFGGDLCGVKAFPHTLLPFFIYLLLMSLCSTEGRRTVTMDEKFFTGYRKTIVKPEEILLSVEIPYSKKGEYFSAFKQASRREDDIAIVTCGMRVLFKDGTSQVEEIKLSYGGMAPTTILALKTCKELTGRGWNDKLLQDACRLLSGEMDLSPSAPGGMVDFRRTLTLSFFFKFYLTVLQKLSKSGTVKCLLFSHQCFHPLSSQPCVLLQEVPKGQAVEDMVGRPLVHVSASKQASGEAVYCDDIPHYENELYLTLVTSTKAHAKILSVDTSEAQSVPGFVCFVSAKDVPGSNVTGIANDETVFAKDVVTCVGHIIGAVLADTQEHSRRAAKAVKIKYEELKPIVTIQEAIEKQSFFKDIKRINKGDVKKGFEESDHILEGEMYLGGQEHFYLETHCTLAVPKGEDGEMELFVSTQNPMKTQEFAANALGVPSNRVVVRVKRMGGGFGGKETRSTILTSVVAVAAFKTGRAVRCMLDRDEDMLISGGRHPFLGRYKVGFMKNGRVKSLEVSYYSNGGNSVDLSHGVMDRALLHLDNSYNIPNVSSVGIVCKTNLPSNTAFRGFGGPQGMMIAECWMSDLARKCGLPPEEVRKLNLYHEGDTTHFNQKLEGFTLRRCWDECLSSSSYHARKKLIEEFNKQNRWKKRGMSIIPTKFGISFTVPFLNQVCKCHLIAAYQLFTFVPQVASRALGVPTSKIYISETSTNTVPNTSPTAASVSADINGMAVYNACQTILKRLEPIKQSNPKGSWEDWVSCLYLIPDVGYNFEKNEGKPFSYFSYGVACSEVEIDCLTGDHKNIRTDIVMDVGTSLNPAIDIGQIEGAFVQGIGLFTMEELRYSPEGNLYTRGPGMYKIPAFGDIPTEFYVSLLRDCPNSKAVYSSKAVGEPPLFLSASVFYAIKDAIYSARKDSGLTEAFRLDSPATPERIRNACVDIFTKMVTAPALTICSLASLPHGECAWKSQGPGAGIRAGWGGCVPARKYLCTVSPTFNPFHSLSVVHGTKALTAFPDAPDYHLSENHYLW